MLDGMDIRTRWRIKMGVVFTFELHGVWFLIGNGGGERGKREMGRWAICLAVIDNCQLTMGLIPIHHLRCANFND